ncbi:MAG: DUF3806 domain-containing protein [Pseudomonadota bacterium]
MTAQIFEHPSPAEHRDLEAMRSWVASITRPEQTVSVAGKLNLMTTLIDAGEVGARDPWKLAALGLLFGDALQQAFEGRLRWVMAQDERGISPALRWRRTDFLIYPISAIRDRITAEEPLDVHTLFAEFSRLFPFRAR